MTQHRVAVSPPPGHVSAVRCHRVAEYEDGALVVPQDEVFPGGQDPLEAQGQGRIGSTGHRGTPGTTPQGIPGAPAQTVHV